MYFYVKTEPGLWTVGTLDSGDWETDSDHGLKREAQERVNYLNGGSQSSSKELELTAKIIAQELRIFKIKVDSYFMSGEGEGYDSFVGITAINELNALLLPVLELVESIGQGEI